MDEHIPTVSLVKLKTGPPPLSHPRKGDRLGAERLSEEQRLPHAGQRKLNARVFGEAETIRVIGGSSVRPRPAPISSTFVP